MSFGSRILSAVIGQLIALAIIVAFARVLGYRPIWPPFERVTVSRSPSPERETPDE